MSKYTVTTWDQDGCEYEVEADSHEEAATECVRLNFANLDYPESIDVFVHKSLELPKKFLVYTVPDVVFRASPRPIGGPKNEPINY